jgi:coproporphyrinogen III oxidase-like Fe-S oxidoreductase
MSSSVNNNWATAAVAVSANRTGSSRGQPAPFSTTPARTLGAAENIRHLYVHIPFCARICPYCAFYKDLLDRSQTQRFCEAIVRELQQYARHRPLVPSTIYFGGGTPTALTTGQLEFVLRGFHEQLDLSHLIEWTMEANPGAFQRAKPNYCGNSGSIGSVLESNPGMTGC